jgi:hypothetical protein
MGKFLETGHLEDKGHQCISFMMKLTDMGNGNRR